MKKPPYIMKEPVVQGGVYWGIVADGQDFPSMFSNDRRAMQRALDAVPEEARGGLSVVRAYVSVTRIVGVRKPARRKIS